MGDHEEKRDADFKVFVGGLNWQMNAKDLQEAFSKYDPTSASIMMDKNTNRPRGFGFVWFNDKLGMEDAIRDMHEKELEGRKISVVRAVPMDQTKPGTPAAALGGGGPRGGGRDYGRYPPRDYGRDAYAGRGGYDRGYDRYGGGAPAAGGYDRPGHDRYGVDPRYAGYDRPGYDSRYGAAAAAYGSAPYARDPYGRDPYAAGAYGTTAAYAGYERGYDSYDSRGAGGPDRRAYEAPRSAGTGPYDRPPERRPDGRR